MEKETSRLLLSFMMLSSLIATSNLSGECQRGGRRTDPNMFYRPANTMSGKTVVVPSGTTFEGRIDTTVSSTKSHAGQAFNLVLSSPVLANGVDVLIPAGSRIVGEVVEAVPSSRVPRQKDQPKPRGKLRVQVTGLRTPDGVTYPLVANLVGESGVNKHSNRRVPLGTSVGYMGSAASFEAVAPNMSEKVRTRPGRAPTVVRKQDLLMDPILGMNTDYGWMNRDSEFTIRSLILQKRDYYIFEGSPLTVKLAAPLKMGITPPVMGDPVMSESEASRNDTLPAPTQKEAVPANPEPKPSPMDTSF